MAPQRVVVLHRWQVAGAFVLLTVSYVAGLWAIGHVQTRLCNRVDRLDATIVDTLQRSEKALPVNAYYREHPDELAAAVREIRRSITAFQGNAC